VKLLNPDDFAKKEQGLYSFLASYPSEFCLRKHNSDSSYTNKDFWKVCKAVCEIDISDDETESEQDSMADAVHCKREVCA
jgi:hypothetical protein